MGNRQTRVNQSEGINLVRRQLDDSTTINKLEQALEFDASP